MFFTEPFFHICVGFVFSSQDALTSLSPPCWFGGTEADHTSKLSLLYIVAVYSISRLQKYRFYSFCRKLYDHLCGSHTFGLCLLFLAVIRFIFGIFRIISCSFSVKLFFWLYSLLLLGKLEKIRNCLWLYSSNLLLGHKIKGYGSI